MHLYSLTLQRCTAINCAVFGNFSGPKQHEIVVARGKYLELLRPDTETGKLQSIVCVDVFGCIRSIIPFRLTGHQKDYIVVGSDSGRIVILEFNPTKNTFDKVHEETYGKSGCRRIVPGQYLAVDPRGRAVMISAIEKQKLVYILNRDSAAKLTISSPLEAHKSHNLIFSVVGVDVGFENPVFACIEVDYQKVEEGEDVEKHLTFYELDLGLNHVVRKWSEEIDPTATMLISVPGGGEGPGGVLVCCENRIFFKNQTHEEVSCPIPRRKGTPEEDNILIVCSATHKQRDMFFFLVQSELGDLYRVTVKHNRETVDEVIVTYFDTIPVCSAMCVMKMGFLFAACENTHQVLYQITSIGSDDDIKEIEVDGDFAYFTPRALRNLTFIDRLDNFSPMLDMKISDILGEGTPQLWTLTGAHTSAALRILKHGLSMTEMAESDLPANPLAVWTVKRSSQDAFDKYIVVSFTNATLVLSIGDSVEEVSSEDSGFLTNWPTVNVGLLGEDSLIQIYPSGIRHIRSDLRIHEWKTPGKKTITHAAHNNRQVVIALSGGEIYYFELDVQDQLAEIARKDMGHEVTCLDIAPVMEGRAKARLMAVGDWNSTVRVLSLDSDDCLGNLAVQQMPSQPASLCIIEMSDPGTEGEGALFLNIGMNDGVLLRTVVDPVTGELRDTRRRFLGTKAVKLFKVKIGELPAIIALSSRSWLCYNFQAKYHMTPLSYRALEYAAPFSSEALAEGIVAIAGNTLRVISPDRLGEVFNHTEVPLRYTPRKMALNAPTGLICTIETDHNAVLPTAKKEPAAGVVKKEEEMDTDAPVFEIPVHGEVDEARRGLTANKAGDGKWASCLRILHPTEMVTVTVHDFPEGEAAFALACCSFHDKDGDVYVCVGTAKGLNLQQPAGCQGVIHTFRLSSSSLELVHSTEVDGIPAALAAYQGRLLAGVGKCLRIYDLGKRKLLRKCENKLFPHMIRDLSVMGDRIYVCDLSESMLFCKYKKSDNQIYIFADDTQPRWLTSHVLLDYDTVAAGDKFGNFFVGRLNQDISTEIEEDSTGSKLRFAQQATGGSSNKIDEIVQFHVGETITAMARCNLVPGGLQLVAYCTNMGGIGAFLPFGTREDVDFFSHLEMHMRAHKAPLCGRDHLWFRSSYFPVKDVIDGDLCEQYTLLDASKQRMIAEELDRTPSEVMKKLEDIRNMML